jgi:hypothetical protein
MAGAAARRFGRSDRRQVRTLVGGTPRLLGRNECDCDPTDTQPRPPRNRFERGYRVKTSFSSSSRAVCSCDRFPIRYWTSPSGCRTLPSTIYEPNIFPRDRPPGLANPLADLECVSGSFHQSALDRPPVTHKWLHVAKRHLRRAARSSLSLAMRSYSSTVCLM